MPKTTIISSKYVKSMTDKQWQEYRNKSWKRKLEFYNKSGTPKWYLNNKDAFIKFLEQKEAKPSKVKNDKSINSKVKELLSDGDYDLFPDE